MAFKHEDLFLNTILLHPDGLSQWQMEDLTYRSQGWVSQKANEYKKQGLVDIKSGHREGRIKQIIYPTAKLQKRFEHYRLSNQITKSPPAPNHTQNNKSLLDQY